MAVQNQGDELVQVSLHSFGAYFVYKVKVPRGIKGKTKAKVDEILSVGVPSKNLQRWCIQHDIIVTNKAVYIHDFNNPILYADGKGNYLKPNAM